MPLGFVRERISSGWFLSETRVSPQNAGMESARPRRNPALRSPAELVAGIAPGAAIFAQGAFRQI